MKTTTIGAGLLACGLAVLAGGAPAQTIKVGLVTSTSGPLAIDPATRDIVHNIYIRETRKIGNRLFNVEIETIPNVKDPWKEFVKK